MRPVLVASLLVVATLFAACQCCTDGPPPRMVSDQPLGARCTRPWDCAAGLECLGRACTISCATSPDVCPAASVCVEAARDSSGNLLQTCLPSCTVEADCLLGATLGTCFGAGLRYCTAKTCKTDADCGGGARCVGVSEARGITWNEYCDEGYCQL